MPGDHLAQFDELDDTRFSKGSGTNLGDIAFTACVDRCVELSGCVAFEYRAAKTEEPKKGDKRDVPQQCILKISPDQISEDSRYDVPGVRTFVHRTRNPPPKKFELETVMKDVDMFDINDEYKRGQEDWRKEQVHLENVGKDAPQKCMDKAYADPRCDHTLKEFVLYDPTTGACFCSPRGQQGEKLIHANMYAPKRPERKKRPEPKASAPATAGGDDAEEDDDAASADDDDADAEGGDDKDADAEADKAADGDAKAADGEGEDEAADADKDAGDE